MSIVVHSPDVFGYTQIDVHDGTGGYLIQSELATPQLVARLEELEVDYHK